MSSDAETLMPTRLDGAMDALGKRRSVLARNLQDPGPNADELNALMETAVRVPDHGRIGPWRMIVFEGEARARFGELLATRAKALDPNASDSLIAQERNRFNRAPVVVGVVSSPDVSRRIPVWEQHLSAGAVCMNLLTAATLSGYGAQWLTEWYAFDEEIGAALSLGKDEQIAGFIYIGTPTEAPTERMRETLKGRVSHF